MRPVLRGATFMAAFSVVLPIALAACGSGSLSTPSTGSSSSAAATTAAASPTAPPTATPTSNPAATPNPGRGQFLLYESSGAWVVKSDGTGKRKVSDGSPVGWSHDGSMVHLATDATKSGCQVTQLSDLPIDGGAETDVPASFKHGDWDFDWSPDDTRIAFFRPTIQRQCGPQTNPDSRMDLMVVDADGTHQRKLAIGVPDGAGASFVWTPDSRSILVIQQDDDPSYAGPIVSIDVVTSAPNQITAASGSYVDAGLSRDGSQIAFVADAGGYDATHVANIDGSGDRNLGDSSSTDHLVSWSPAGSSLAVLRGDRHDGPTHLVVAASPSAPLRDLYNPLAWKGAGPKISWSPDAARVACIAAAGGIVVVATDGSGAAPIPNAAGATDVFWQP